MIAAIVVLAVLVVSLAAAAAWFAATAHARTAAARVSDTAHEHDQARISELLHLLEARMAPAEYAAYVAPAPAAPPERLYSDDGLAWVEVDD